MAKVYEQHSGTLAACRNAHLFPDQETRSLNLSRFTSVFRETTPLVIQDLTSYRSNLGPPRQNRKNVLVHLNRSSGHRAKDASDLDAKIQCRVCPNSSISLTIPQGNDLILILTSAQYTVCAAVSGHHLASVAIRVTVAYGRVRRQSSRGGSVPHDP